MKKEIQEKSRADKIMEAFLFSFPTITEFNELIDIVAQGGYRHHKDETITEEQADGYIQMLQNLKWVREAVY